MDAAQVALAGIRQLLADHEADVRGRLGAQPGARQWVAARVVAGRHHRIRQAALLTGPLTRRVVAPFGRRDLRIGLSASATTSASARRPADWAGPFVVSAIAMRNPKVAFMMNLRVAYFVEAICS